MSSPLSGPSGARATADRWARGGRARRLRRALAAALAVGPLVVRAAPPAPAADAAARHSVEGPGWRVVESWRAAADAPDGGVLDPVDLDLAPDGTAYVVDRGLHRVQRFAPDGAPGGHLGGGDGLLPGALSSPLGVAVDATRGRVVVADTGHDALAVFAVDGGRAAWAPLAQPESVALAGDGRTFVYERRRNAVSAWTPAGVEDLAFPVQRALSFVADLPRGLAVAPGGTVFFAAENPQANAANVLYEFTAGGDTLPPRTRVDWQIFDIAFDAAGRMWLLDGSNARLVGDLDRGTGASGPGVAIPGGARALAADASGRLAVLYGPTADRPAGLLALEATGAAARVIARSSFPSPDPGWLPAPRRLAAAPDGGVVVTDDTERATELGPTRDVRDAIARPGLQLAARLAGGDWLVARTRFAATYDDRHDPDVAAPGTRRIRVERTPAGGGAPRWTWERVEAIDAAPPTILVALAPDGPAGVTDLLDGGGGRVFTLAVDGTLVATRTLPARAGVPGWTDLARAPDGALLALHAGSRVVVRAHEPGGAATPLAVDATPLRFDVGADGTLVVVLADRRVAVLDADGQAQGAPAALPAPERGAVEAPGDVVVTTDGAVRVADGADRAVHRLAPAARNGRRTLWLPSAGR